MRSVFHAAVIRWTSALAGATWRQIVQTVCPWGLTHSQTLHQIFTSYLSRIIHHGSQITVSGTTLTWHPSTGISSQPTRLRAHLLIPFLDSLKMLQSKKSLKGNPQSSFLLARKCMFLISSKFCTASREFTASLLFPSWKTNWCHQ